MEINFVDLGVQVAGVLSPFMLAGLGWLGTELAKLVRARTGSQVASTAVLRLNDAVSTVVVSLEQTMVATAKARSADGKLTLADADAIKAAALANIKSYIGPAGLQLFAKAFGVNSIGIEDIISTKVETAVYAVGQGAVPTLAGQTAQGVVAAPLLAPAPAAVVQPQQLPVK